LLVIGVGLGSWQNTRRAVNEVDAVTSSLQAIVQPSSSLFGGITLGTADFLRGVAASRSLVDENRRLRKALGAANLYTEQLDRLQNDLDQLRRLQGIGSRPGVNAVAARITGFYPYENRITIDVGSKQGVHAGMPVVCADGLVGIVQTVEAGRAQALMLTSKSVQIGAMAIGHNPPPAGLVEGVNSSSLTLNLLDPKAPISIGDTVVTSGFGERIPRGLVIGKVIQVEDDAQYGKRTAQIDPAVSIGSIQEVKILK
jgi:rod shape-determining protein MreC